MTDLVEVAPPPGGVGGAVVRAIRPRQWLKNVLVFAAPGSAGLLGQTRPLLLTAAAAGLFCAAASATYLVNDARDVHADRAHPTKRHRPVAAGQLSVVAAYGLAATLALGAVIGGLLIDWRLALVLVGYIGLTVAYSVSLKHVPVIDLVTVAAGFVLRALAGAAAVGVAVSNWFFVVTTFGSLLMVSGKRSAELVELGTSAETRTVMNHYSDGFLRHVRSVATSGAVLAYSLWAFERADLAHLAGTPQPLPFYQVSIAPFITGCLYYSLLLERGLGGAPEDLVIGDRMLQVIGVCWFALFAAGLATTT